MSEKSVETRPPKIYDGEEYHYTPPTYQGPIDHGYHTFGGLFYVNFDKSPHLQELYQQVEPEKQAGTLEILKKVNGLVASTFPPSSGGVREVLIFTSKVTGKGIIASLDKYIEARIGMCGHAALAGAAILERLTKEGWLKGKVFLDHHTERLDLAAADGHIWYGFETENGERYLLDALYEYVGDEEGYKPVLERVMNDLIDSSPY